LLNNSWKGDPEIKLTLLQSTVRKNSTLFDYIFCIKNITGKCLVCTTSLFEPPMIQNQPCMMSHRKWYLEVESISSSINIILFLGTARSADDVRVNKVGSRQEDLNNNWMFHHLQTSFIQIFSISTEHIKDRYWTLVKVVRWFFLDVF